MKNTKINDQDQPKFKARSTGGNVIDCPWCGHGHDIYDDPSKFLPSDNEDYEDEKKKCSKCQKEFFVSCEISIDYMFISRYKPADEFELYSESLG